MDWAAFYYLEGGLLFGFLAAAGLTLISLVRPDYRIARRCAWAAAILFGQHVAGVDLLAIAHHQVSVGRHQVLLAIAASRSLGADFDRWLPLLIR